MSWALKPWLSRVPDARSFTLSRISPGRRMGPAAIEDRGGGSFLPRRSIRSTYGSIRPTGALARKAEIGQTLTGLAQKYHVAVPAVCRQGAL